MALGLILLIIAFGAIFASRSLGLWTPSSDRQIRDANAGDSGMIMYPSTSSDDHYPGDGHDHSGDGADSGSGESGGDSD